MGIHECSYEPDRNSNCKAKHPRENLDEHLVRVAGVRLLLLEVRALVLELVVELLKHVNDAL